MENNIKVSVIVPVYNVEKYLQQCLDSIAAQTLKELEVICIDDGSADDSPKILDDYQQKDHRFRVIHKGNTGYGHTMNVGLDAARGEYIGIVESDDFAEPDMFEKLYETAKKEKAEVVRANYYNFEKGKDEFENRLEGYPLQKMISYETHPELIALTNSIWSAVYRNDFIRQNQIRFHETPGASYQDTSFACLVWLYAKRVFLIPDAVLHYRRDNTNSSIYAPGKVFCICDEWHRVEEFLKVHPEKEKVVKKHQAAVKYAGYLYNYNRLAGCFQYTLLLQIEKELKEDFAKGYMEERYFTPSVWSSVNEIIRDKDIFFKETSKDYQDERMQICNIMNYKIYVEAFYEKMKRFETTIIYGAGVIGKQTLEELRKRNIQPAGFAVTNSSGNNSTVMGLPVKVVKDWASYRDRAVILIAVKEKNQFEVYQVLEKQGFRHIITIDNYYKIGITAK